MAVGFFDMMGVGLVVPALPEISKNYAVGPFATACLISLYPLSQAIGSVLLGRMSDARGRPGVILATVFGAALANVGFGLSASFTLLCLTRAATGFMAGNISVVHALLSDETPAEQRATVLGRFVACCSLGFIAGQAASALAGVALLDKWASQGPFVLLATAQLLVGLALLARGASAVAKPDEAGAGPKLSAGEMLSIPAMSLLLLCQLITTHVFIGFGATAPLYFARISQLEQASIGGIFACIGLYMIFVRTLLVGPVSKRLGDTRAMAGAFVSMGLGLLLFPLAKLDGLLVLSLFFLCTGYALLVPVVLAQISARVTPKTRGAALGFAGMANSLGAMTGPFLGGFMLEHVGPSSPFRMAAAVCVVAAPFALNISARVVPASAAAR
jgi:DHA1 family tetracycline resistance protein-like MFS transporter